MPETDTDFTQLNELLETRGVSETLSFLSTKLESEKKYFELFEILKMQVRHGIGLPLTPSDQSETLNEQDQRTLEDELFSACEKVGKLLMADGQVREAWTYLRPVGKMEETKKLLQSIEVTDDNVDAIVEVALTEGVAPEYGFGIVLDRYGTCNSITTFDAEISRRSPAEQQGAASLLINHLHHELVANVIGDIEKKEEKKPSETTLLELVKDRPWLFEGNSYHIDTTHLASVIRFARVLTAQDVLSTAIDLTEYARRLSDQYHYDGDEPFKDLYESSNLYLSALTGKDVEEACSYFEEKARNVDAYYDGTIAIETYVNLLARTKQYDKAISASCELLPDGPRIGIAPTLFDLCTQSKSFDRLKEHCQEKNDILGYAMSLLIQHQEEKS